MDQVHIHLLITHLPIFGSILGGFVLAHGIWSKSDQTKISAYNVLVISSVGAVIAYLTGEGAEEAATQLFRIRVDRLCIEDAPLYRRCDTN